MHTKSFFIKLTMAGLLFSFVFFACTKDPLNLTPSNTLSDATVFGDTATAYLFLNDIYNQVNPGPWSSTFTNLPTEISNDPLEDFTDNATYGPASGTLSSTVFDNDSYGASATAQLFGPQWTNMYAYIRKCNLFMQKVTATNFSDGSKKSMIAQARFLRAYFYKSLVDLYGGVPIITRVLDNTTQGDSIFYARSSYDSCVGFIESECRAAAADLPASWSGLNIGRATSGAAFALQGEEELYAGKWEAAAVTNLAIMNSKTYKLFPDFTGLFYMGNENNSEVIFDIQYAANIRPRHNNQYWGVVEVAKGAGWGDCDPTQELVDEFEFTDGKTSTQGSALYDPAHPYLHREKRFYASIIYDGSIWRGETIYTRKGIANNANEINTTGKSGNCGRTGYFVKKLQDSTIASTPNNLDGTNVIVFRYAEVLLNYAEAQNEAVGPDASVYGAVNLVRERAGQPDLPAGLSQADMRTRLRHERRVELAFEGKRFYDLMRWKTAAQVYSQPIHGMLGTGSASSVTYSPIVVRNVKFDPSKNYLQPIPQTVLDQNPKLTQNPNY
jgi:hypothetical protein